MTKLETIQTKPSTAIESERFGVLVHASDCSIEVDLCSMLPDRCVAHFSRMENYETCAIRKTDHRRDLVNAALLLAECDNISAVIYGCTSGELLHGPNIIETAIKDVLTKVFVVTPIRAAIEAMQMSGIGTVLILSPYSKDLNLRLVELFERHSITVHTVFSPLGWGQRSLSTIDDRELETAAASIEISDSEALFVPCNALAIVDVIKKMEACTGVPVFTSTQVSVWKVLKNLDRLQEQSLTRFGSIFSRAAMARQ